MSSSLPSNIGNRDSRDELNRDFSISAKTENVIDKMLQNSSVNVVSLVVGAFC